MFLCNNSVYFCFDWTIETNFRVTFLVILVCASDPDCFWLFSFQFSCLFYWFFFHHSHHGLIPTDSEKKNSIWLNLWKDFYFECWILICLITVIIRIIDCCLDILSMMDHHLLLDFLIMDISLLVLSR